MPISGELVAGALAGLAFIGCSLGNAAPTPGQRRRREVVVNGKRVKTVDIHAHTIVPEAAAVISHPLEAPGLLWSNVSDRIQEMEAEGIDVEALSINPYWYRAERDAAAELIKIQNEKLAEFCAATPDRFVAFATVALQHPDLAVEQLQYAIRTLGLRGLSVGGSVTLVPRAVRRLHGDGRWRGGLFLPYAGGGPAALEYHHSRRARHRTESKSNATRVIEEQAAQCGNCTAGMIMRAQAQLERMLV